MSVLIGLANYVKNFMIPSVLMLPYMKKIDGIVRAFVVAFYVNQIPTVPETPG